MGCMTRGTFIVNKTLGVPDKRSINFNISFSVEEVVRTKRKEFDITNANINATQIKVFEARDMEFHTCKLSERYTYINETDAGGFELIDAIRYEGLSWEGAEDPQTYNFTECHEKQETDANNSLGTVEIVANNEIFVTMDLNSQFKDVGFTWADYDVAGLAHVFDVDIATTTPRTSCKYQDSAKVIQCDAATVRSFNWTASDSVIVLSFTIDETDTIKAGCSNKYCYVQLELLVFRRDRTRTSAFALDVLNDPENVLMGRRRLSRKQEYRLLAAELDDLDVNAYITTLPMRSFDSTRGDNSARDFQIEKDNDAEDAPTASYLPIVLAATTLLCVALVLVAYKPMLRSRRFLFNPGGAGAKAHIRVVPAR